eukprot:SAG31_NODE_24683_length_476_cov_1.095491_1_plen_91_part_01
MYFRAPSGCTRRRRRECRRETDAPADKEANVSPTKGQAVPPRQRLTDPVALRMHYYTTAKDFWVEAEWAEETQEQQRCFRNAIKVYPISYL